MKTEILLSTFLMMACSKKEAVTEITTGNDSAAVSDEVTVNVPADSPQNGVVSMDAVQNQPPVSGTFRAREGNKIIKTINGDMIPLSVRDEFVNDDQQYILKIKNFGRQTISGEITPEYPQMNIRFNQIRLPNGEYDGPFGREISYNIKDKGEIWLIIGRSNMASGASTGKFEIQIR